MAKTFEILKAFNERLEKGKNERLAKEKDLKKRISGYEKTIDGLMAKLEKINKQVKENRAEYRKLLDAEIEERNKLTAENDELKRRHERGELTLSEFMAQMKSSAQIEKTARARIAEKLKTARIAARDVAVKQKEILKDIEMTQNKIGVHVKEFWRRYVELLNREKEGLEKYLSFGYGGGSRHQHETNYLISTGYGYDAANLKPQSWDELEFLVIEGLIQEKHFNEFDKMIQKLRSAGLDFEKHKLAINYRSGKAGYFKEGIEYRIFDKNNPGVIIG